jgi:hypothetical protein
MAVVAMTEAIMGMAVVAMVGDHDRDQDRDPQALTCDPNSFDLHG